MYLFTGVGLGLLPHQTVANDRIAFELEAHRNYKFNDDSMHSNVKRP